MQYRDLGTAGLKVSAIGLGCMSMSWAYGSPDEAEGIRTIHRALDLGVNFLDTAEVYGPYTNEELVGRALKGKRDRAIVATKFGFKIENGVTKGPDSHPKRVKEVADESLKRLGIDHIDLFYQHRVDPKIPIEETVGAMSELVEAGKIRYLGLSEAGPDTLRRACREHPISALQSEYSLWERGLEERILPCARELGIGLVAYSPVGRGFLTGQIKSFDDIAEDDYRRCDPRYQGANFAKNLQLVEQVKKVASKYDATPAQVAIAWLLMQGKDIIPIPGTKRVKYLEENSAAFSLVLEQRDLESLEELAQRTSGDRYEAKRMALIER
ncbi:MAG: aldo/keto reductase [Cyanobacteria bacterium DS2.3.42]|nr:aldo/keto reductase [Cyanobacteria bacterium DS2.3.42]